MYLEKLKLTNFRTYKNLKLDFSKGVNIFVGNNAEGKTNIIESIYLSCITKSYRTIKDSECILFGEEYFRNIHTYIAENKKTIVEVFLDKNNKKQIKQDDLKITKYSNFVGKIPVVMFSPEDMYIVKGSPRYRRKFLDILISQISKKYVICLQEYNKLIQLKNNTLKLDVKNIDSNYLDVLDEKIAEKVYYLSTIRSEYVEKINVIANNIQNNLSKENEKLKLKYLSEFSNENTEGIKKILKYSRENDIMRKTSNKGIGHDDIVILVNEKDVSKFGSQGQNRTALLSLKLAEFEILKEKKETTPILLLDDVFSELDSERINFLIDYVSKYQVFITTTEVDCVDNIENKIIFKVQKGIVEKIKK